MLGRFGAWTKVHNRVKLETAWWMRPRDIGAEKSARRSPPTRSVTKGQKGKPEGMEMLSYPLPEIGGNVTEHPCDFFVALGFGG